MENLIKGSKKGGGVATVAKEDPNTLQSIQYAKILDVIAEGEIEGLIDGERSIYLNGIPVKNDDGSYNFSGFNFTERTGLPHSLQEHIAGFDGVESSYPVGQKVVKLLPIVHHIPEENTDRVIVTISTPRLMLQDTTNGDVHGTHVQFMIEQKPAGGVYENVLEFNSAPSVEHTFNVIDARHLILTTEPTYGISFDIVWNRETNGTVMQFNDNGDARQTVSWSMSLPMVILS